MSSFKEKIWPRFISMFSSPLFGIDTVRAARRGTMAAAAVAGFTLIELLVVIAIIGILASIVLVSLNGARAKGRDAKRVADLQAFAQLVLSDNNADSNVAFSTCTVAGANRASTCTVPNGAAFKDPSGSATACAAGALAAACDYSVSGASVFAQAPKFNDWQIKTYLESGSGSFGAGAVCINYVSPTYSGTLVSGATCK